MVEHVRRGHAEVRDDAPRDGRADAGDEPAAEVALQAGQAGGHHRPHLGDLELPAVARVLHPVAEQLHSLAGREERHHADDSHGRAIIRFELGHRVAGLVVAVGQAADRAAQRLRHATGLGSGRRTPRPPSGRASGSPAKRCQASQHSSHRKTKNRPIWGAKRPAGAVCVSAFGVGEWLFTRHFAPRSRTPCRVAVIGAASPTPHSSVRSSQSSPASHGASSVEAPCALIWLPYTPARNAARRSSG